MLNKGRSGALQRLRDEREREREREALVWLGAVEIE
jgi:hypothetical protein